MNTCTPLSEQGSKARSTPVNERQQGRPGAAHGGRVGVKRLPNSVAALLLLAHLLCTAPRLAHGAGASGAQPVLQPVALDQAWAGAVQARTLALSDQPRPDWLTGLVEFLSAVPPECSAVSKQNTQQKCQQRERGVLERFKERHPVAFNLVVMAVTLLAGFWVGGGFKGGE